MAAAPQPSKRKSGKERGKTVFCLRKLSTTFPFRMIIIYAGPKSNQDNDNRNDNLIKKKIVLNIIGQKRD